MWQEIYYEYYSANCKGDFWVLEEKILPYSIKCRNGRSKKAIEKLLSENGFRGVYESQSAGLLVNLEFKRFCGYPRHASISCVDSHSYSEEEFLSEIYCPWHLKTNYGVDAETARPLADMYLEKYRSYCRDPGMSDEEMQEEQIVLV